MPLTDRPDFELLPKRSQRALKRLAQRSVDGPDSVDFSADPLGHLVYLSGNFAMRSTSAPADIAREFLATNAALFGFEPDLTDLGDARVEDRPDGTAVRFQQIAHGIPVYRAGFHLELDPQHTLTTVCGRKVETADAPRKPKLSRRKSEIVARDYLGLRDSVELVPELVLTDVHTDFLKPQSPPVRASWCFSLAGLETKADVLVESQGEPVVVTTPVGDTDVHECPSDVPLYHLNELTGVPDFVTFGSAGVRTSRSSTQRPEAAALAFFSDHPEMFGTGDVHNQLQVAAVQRDPGPPFMSHVVLQQMYGGLEVFGAQLRVHLTPSLSVSSIGGTYVRDLRVVPEPLIQQHEARDTAVKEIRNFRNQNQIPDDPALDVADDGIVCFPGDVTQTPYARNAVAWRFRFPEATVLVDARSDEVHGGLLFAYPHQLGAQRNIYDALGRSEISLPLLVMKDSSPLAGTPQNAEVAPADAFLSQVLAFYAGLGRSSWDGNDSPAEFVTNSTFVVTPTAGAHWDIFRQQAWFQASTMGAWLAGHEFTHGVTMSTAFLMPIDESGALNEHYSDIMGSVIVGSFPITTSPSNYGGYVSRSPTCAGPVAVLGPGCDTGNVHINCGIGNIAAISLANGDATPRHAGIGMNRLGRLFFDTLTTRMHPWSTYIDERLNTWETARDLAARGVLVTDDADPKKTLDFSGVAQEVSWAFSKAGVDPRLIPGWFSVPGGHAGQPPGQLQSWFVGQSSPNCTLVGDIELVVRALDPVHGQLPWWEGRSRVTGPGGGSVMFPGGIFGATITAQSVGTRAKETTTTFFHSGFIPFDFHPVIIEIRDPACGPPPSGGPPPTSDFVSTGPTHWSHIGLGGKGTDNLNWPFLIREPGGAGCTLDMIEVELLDKNGQTLARTSPGQSPAVHRYGPNNSLSFGVEATRWLGGSSSAGVDVHWWFDFGSAVRYRVHYYCTGESCDIR